MSTTRNATTKIAATTATKKSSTRKAKEPEQVNQEIIEEEVSPSEEESSPTEEGETAVDEKTDKRRIPTRETIIQTFEELIASVEKEVEILRESDAKTKGVKFLRTLNKKLKVLKNQSSKLIKQKKPSTKKPGNNASGFLKVVKLSKEMSKFAGWDNSEMKSRVDVTKFLCDYIKENNLQNQADRRQILPDQKLAKLLAWDPKKETQPLSYFVLQNKIKGHFLKEPKVTSSITA